MEHGNWAVVLLLAILCSAILGQIAAARRGKQIEIRRIPGLDAFDEALGRAVELGRPILFSPGFGELRDMSTYAGLAVLEHAIRHAARFGIRVIVPVAYPATFPVTQATVRDTYASEGRSDLYRPEDVMFLNSDQNAFAAAVCGLMERERVGAAFYFGYYGYESLLIAETGNRIGAMQVAATDALLQVPFFLASADYTMFGEELYAAGAYLSRQPVLLGSVAGQDIGKLVVSSLIIVGVLAALFSPAAGGFSPLVGWLQR